MKRISVLLAIIVAISNVAFAATEYVIANDNVVLFNSLSVYELDTTTGTLTQVAALATGGKGLGTQTGEVLYNTMQTISANGSCIFAFDTFSNDIATFSKVAHYARVGNFSNEILNANAFGGSIAVTPDGKFVYATYSSTQNVGAWAVNPDCSLTFIAAYFPSSGGLNGPLRVTPNGNQLLVVNSKLVETFGIDRASGSLTDVGYLSFDSVPGCDSGTESCFATSLDITKDSRVAVFASDVSIGNGTAPIALAAQITANGLVKPRGWSLKNSANIDGNWFPFFSAGGYSGDGNLYFGMNDGVVTTNFTENPLRISVAATTIISPLFNEAGIAVSGNILVQAQYPGQIAVLAINADGSLTTLSTTDLKSVNPGMFSLSIFPSTR